MAHLTVFAKGNSDISESLFLCREGTETWNGLNAVLRIRHPDWRVRLRHETMARSDTLLAATGVVPEVLRHLPLAWPYAPDMQFSAAFYEPADAHVLSIQADVAMRLVRHRETGVVFYVASAADWPADARAWLRASCESSPFLSPEQSFANFSGIIERLRRSSAAPLLIYNMSAVVLGETVDCYAGLDETLSTRIRRFNLMLIELSARTGAIVVDVDRLAARVGADKVKLESLRLNQAGSRLVAEDVVRILEANDCFASGA